MVRNLPPKANEQYERASRTDEVLHRERCKVFGRGKGLNVDFFNDKTLEIYKSTPSAFPPCVLYDTDNDVIDIDQQNGDNINTINSSTTINTTNNNPILPKEPNSEPNSEATMFSPPVEGSMPDHATVIPPTTGEASNSSSNNNPTHAAAPAAAASGSSAEPAASLRTRLFSPLPIANSQSSTVIPPTSSDKPIVHLSSTLPTSSPTLPPTTNPNPHPRIKDAAAALTLHRSLKKAFRAYGITHKHFAYYLKLTRQQALVLSVFVDGERVVGRGEASKEDRDLVLRQILQFVDNHREGSGLPPQLGGGDWGVGKKTKVRKETDRSIAKAMRALEDAVDVGMEVSISGRGNANVCATSYPCGSVGRISVTCDRGGKGRYKVLFQATMNRNRTAVTLGEARSEEEGRGMLRDRERRRLMEEAKGTLVEDRAYKRRDVKALKEVDWR